MLAKDSLSDLNFQPSNLIFNTLSNDLHDRLVDISSMWAFRGTLAVAANVISSDGFSDRSKHAIDVGVNHVA